MQLTYLLTYVSLTE